MILDNPTFDSTSRGFSGEILQRFARASTLFTLKVCFVKCSTLDLHVVDYFNSNNPPRINVKTDFLQIRVKVNPSTIGIVNQKTILSWNDLFIFDEVFWRGKIFEMTEKNLKEKEKKGNLLIYLIYLSSRPATFFQPLWSRARQTKFRKYDTENLT